jgi:hypothetical protein
MARGMAQVIECLSSKCKALSSNSSTAKKEVIDEMTRWKICKGRTGHCVIVNLESYSSKPEEVKFQINISKSFVSRGVELQRIKKIIEKSCLKIR